MAKRNDDLAVVLALGAMGFAVSSAEKAAQLKREKGTSRQLANYALGLKQELASSSDAILAMESRALNAEDERDQQAAEAIAKIAGMCNQITRLDHENGAYRQRAGEAEQRGQVLDREKAALEAKVAALEAENAQLKTAGATVAPVPPAAPSA